MKKVLLKINKIAWIILNTIPILIGILIIPFSILDEFFNINQYFNKDIILLVFLLILSPVITSLIITEENLNHKKYYWYGFFSLFYLFYSLYILIKFNGIELILLLITPFIPFYLVIKIIEKIYKIVNNENTKY